MESLSLTSVEKFSILGPMSWKSPKLALLVFAFAISGCASDSWTKTDTKYEIAFQVINAADAYTTSRIRHTYGVEETNPITRAIVGAQPNEADVALLFITYGISHYVIARALPEKWRRFYQVGTALYSASLVIENCNLGLCP